MADAGPDQGAPQDPVVTGLRKRGRPRRGSEAEITERILDAAQSVFLKEGFDGAKLDAIAAAAGTSKRTFYARFKSKSDVFEAVVQRMIEDAFRPLSVEGTGGSHRERLHRLAQEMLAQSLSPDIAALERMLIGVAPRFPELPRRLNEFARKRGVVLVERCLAAGIAAGEFACADPGFAAEHFLSAMIRVPMIEAATGIHSAELTFVKRETLRQAVDLFIGGVAANAPGARLAANPSAPGG